MLKIDYVFQPIQAPSSEDLEIDKEQITLKYEETIKTALETNINRNSTVTRDEKTIAFFASLTSVLLYMRRFLHV